MKRRNNELLEFQVISPCPSKLCCRGGSLFCQTGASKRMSRSGRSPLANRIGPLRSDPQIQKRSHLAKWMPPLFPVCWWDPNFFGRAPSKLAGDCPFFLNACFGSSFRRRRDLYLLRLIAQVGLQPLGTPSKWLHGGRAKYR